ncbi:hypothetical protein FRUB_00344 [Fimbriiglobus ruber]|uniref:Uncharacterized protein n=1 Tax=Fimbriiglobus ruber TaxID=1908690 RepID=A0A225EE24_9BACT|nr:hypothetical protein FRUB_00344 [Fimbriiglobus ruber]
MQTKAAAKIGRKYLVAVIVVRLPAGSYRLLLNFYTILDQKLSPFDTVGAKKVETRRQPHRTRRSNWGGRSKSDDLAEPGQGK